MSMFKPFMRDTITLVYDIEDTWGEHLGSTEVDHPARVTLIEELEMNWRGESVVADSTVLVDKDVSVEPGQIVKIDSVRRTVYRVQRVKDFQVRAQRFWAG
jgi:hypothetical protein